MAYKKRYSRIFIGFVFLSLVISFLRHLFAKHFQYHLRITGDTKYKYTHSSYKKGVYLINSKRNSFTSCKKLLVVCVPKTSSSALRFIFDQLNNDLCKGFLFNHFSYLPKGSHTLTYKTLSNFRSLDLCNKGWIISHMVYDNNMKNLMCSQNRYRIGTLREPMSRIKSLITYETRRPLKLTSALQYLLAEKSVAYSKDSFSSFSYQSIESNVENVLSDYDFIFLQEFHDESLAVLMYDLNLRIDDILVPVLNAKNVSISKAQVSQSFFDTLKEDDSRDAVEYISTIDTLLYSKASKLLFLRFRSLPFEYQIVPDLLKKLRLMLMKECKIALGSRRFSVEETKCILERRKIYFEKQIEI